MPRDSNGAYSLPAGYLATAGDTIQPSQHNPPLEDIASSLTGSLPRTGSAPMTGPMKAADGSVGAPSISFASALSTGFYKTDDGVGLSLSGTLAVEFTADGFLPDKVVTLRKLYHPSGPSKLLGSDSNAALTITGAADNGSGLVRLTVSSTATFATGQSKTVADVLGTTEANGTWTITVIDGTHIDLQASAFANTYVSGGTIGGGWEEITISTGFTQSGSTLKAAFPPPSAFKKLVIKVASNTTITVTADFVTSTNGSGSYQTTAISSTVNMATTGVDALDTGGIAQGTWYYLWQIVKADGTTKVIASLQSTANATFLSNLAAIASGAYTFYAYLGAVRTAAGSAQLMGTWQFGRKVQYVLGLAQTTGSIPNIVNGVSSSTYADTTPTYAAVSISNFVPPTASHIIVVLMNAYNNSTIRDTIVAPNTGYSGILSTNPPVASLRSTTSQSAQATLLLEATTVAYAGGGAGSALFCHGWEDNI